MKRPYGGRTAWMGGSIELWESAWEGEPGQWPRGDGKITSIGVHDDGGNLEIDPVVWHTVSIIIVELRD
jgi:hypothetical protein